LLLRIAQRRGWLALIGASALLWAFAQLGGGSLLHEGVTQLGAPLPLDAYGAFNWFAWQLVWVAGLWLGFRQERADGVAARAIRWRGWPMMAGALAVSVFFLLWRQHVGGLLTGLGAGWAPLDKWTLGPLRIANCIALGLVLQRTLLPALRWLRVHVLELLGRNSLQVFAAHIPICVLADGLLGPHGAPPAPPEQAMLLVGMLALILLVALRSETRARDRRRAAAQSTRARKVATADTSSAATS
jgi:hypothetical protein